MNIEIFLKYKKLSLFKMVYKNILISLWRKIFRRKYDENEIVRLLFVSDEVIYHIEKLILLKIEFVETEKKRIKFCLFLEKGIRNTQ